MRVFVSIDDTDNADSPGSGHLAARLAKHLQEEGLVRHCSNITRHQLYVHDDIPYTSGNSSMCFVAESERQRLSVLTDTAARFLRDFSAPGSDPGLCIAVDDSSGFNSLSPADMQELIDFGRRAKQEVLSKDAAYVLAGQVGVHLSEHGGTGGGVIGALAGIGLRLSGEDGRFRGWIEPEEGGAGVTSVGELCGHPWVDSVVEISGCGEGGAIILPESTAVLLSGEKIKTILRHHRQVIPVVRIAEAGGEVADGQNSGSPVAMFRTFSKREAKAF